MPKDDKAEEGSFKVTDRRLFTQEGELKPDVGLETAKPAPTKTAEPSRAAGREARERAPDPTSPGRHEEELGIDFASFVLSLATSAMMHMGEIPDPVTGKPVEDLTSARQTIDVLSILKDKTKGNLSADEERLMDHLLYELRLKFLGRTKVVKL
jgi:hypothetical protein